MKLTKSLPLIPTLPCATKARERFDVAGGFQDGDMLHLSAGLCGYPAGAVVPVQGFLRCLDLDGTPYRVLVYLLARPGSICGLPFARRSAVLSPEAIQDEVFFIAYQPYLVEVDVTDHAHELALSRLTEPRVIPMYDYSRPLEWSRQAA